MGECQTMLRLLKFEINELSQRKGILRICLSSQIMLIILILTLPKEVLLTVTMAFSSITSMFIMYALDVTKSFSNTPGTDKRKLLISFPVTRREYAFRSIVLYTAYIGAQVVVVVIPALIAAIKTPGILVVIPVLALGIIISLGAIVGAMFIFSFVTGTSVKSAVLSIIAIMPLFIYVGYLIGYSSVDGKLPSIWICLIALLVYVLGVFVELVVTPRID
jgi:hypothetical protein